MEYSGFHSAGCARQRELIQNDLTCILDGIDDEIINNACQVVVDRFAILLVKLASPALTSEQLIQYDKLDVKQQISMEERIAAIIFDAQAEADAEEWSFNENKCNELGKRIVYEVLREFRPDVFEPALTRERLIQEVNDYLTRLSDAGDQAALNEVLAPVGDQDHVKLSDCSDEWLQWVYNNYIKD